jgi:hypothetical protein
METDRLAWMVIDGRVVDCCKTLTVNCEWVSRIYTVASSLSSPMHGLFYHWHSLVSLFPQLAQGLV